MSAYTDRIATLLRQDGTIQFHCGQRVYGFDIRQTGAVEANSVYDAEGFLQPTICIDDRGGLRRRDAPSGSYNDTLDVWVLAERFPAGSATLDALVGRIVTILHRWQDGPTKALLTYSGRLGQQYDPPPDSGMLDRVSFAKSGIFVGIKS